VPALATPATSLGKRKLSLPPAREQAMPLSEKQRTVSEGTSLLIQSQIATERLGVKQWERSLNINNVWRTWQDMREVAEIRGIADETLAAAIDVDFNFNGEDGEDGEKSDVMVPTTDGDRKGAGKSHTEDEGLRTTATMARLIMLAEGRGRKRGFHV
ncbi:MAG: hypothetical protein Q9198_009242, partial [Flavoplaca austrocitrina]